MHIVSLPLVPSESCCHCHVQEYGRDDTMLHMAAKLAKAVRAVSSSWEPPTRDKKPPAQQHEAKQYNPYVPGRVLFMHRCVWEKHRACH